MPLVKLTKCEDDEPEPRLSRFAPSFFPETHSAHVRAGVHYTETTLRQMTPVRKATMVSLLCNRIMADRGITRYALVDACAGAGGNTMAFCANPAVGTLYAYEADEAVFRLLKRNIGSLSACWPKVELEHRTTDLRHLCTIAAASPLPVGYFVDPPWGLKRPYLDIFYHPVGASGERVVDWIAALLQLPSVQFVMVKVPKAYQFDPHSGMPPNTLMHRYRSITKMDMLTFTRHQQPAPPQAQAQPQAHNDKNENET